ncbi:MAG TPA: hypothetical protein VLE72_04390 [Candidatus Saccharimonadales bacterium]|nr:hypothetical protein [Candidatus Saccharimonadales bacterium]
MEPKHNAELERWLQIKGRATRKAYDFMSRRLRYVGRRGLTRRELLDAFLPRLSKAEREALYDSSCYYYESQEGPYDRVIEQALEWNVIAISPDDGRRFILGPRATPPRRKR